jgi:hypothetical protein
MMRCRSLENAHKEANHRESGHTNSNYHSLEVSKCIRD